MVGSSYVAPPMKTRNHPLFQDGILQDTVSNTTFSQTLIFQGVLTPILCTNQDNNFQYRFFARKINPRIWVPRWKNTKLSWSQDILLARQNFSMAVKFQVYFLPGHVLEKNCLENLYLAKRQLVLIFLSRNSYSWCTFSCKNLYLKLLLQLVHSIGVQPPKVFKSVLAITW